MIQNLINDIMPRTKKWICPSDSSVLVQEVTDSTPGSLQKFQMIEFWWYPEGLESGTAATERLQTLVTKPHYNNNPLLVGLVKWNKTTRYFLLLK